MYVNGIAVGVFCTLFIEMAIIIVRNRMIKACKNIKSVTQNRRKR